MSGEAILRAIETETAAEVERTVGAAGEQAARLVEAAGRAARAQLDAGLAAGEPAIEAEAMRLVNAARLRLLHRRAELAAAASEAAWAEAQQRLSEVVSADGDRWAAALVRLTAAALEIAGPDATVRVRAVDAPAVSAIVAAGQGALETLGNEAPPGPIVRSRDGHIEVDATLSARLERARVALAEEVAGLLGTGA